MSTGRKKNEKVYFSDRLALVRYVNDIFSRQNTIARMDGKKLTKKEVEALLYTNIDYTYELNKVANTCKVEPRIIELYLNNRKESAKKICSIIKKQYRFMDSVTINGQIVCDGIANGISNTLFIGDKMLDMSKDLIEIIEKNMYTQYLFNGQPATLLDIMTVYEKTQPSNITRLKGLGEQDPEELAESVVYPDHMGGNRTLVRYTMDTAMKEIEDIRYYENNKNKLLDNIVVTRMDITD
jgi:DNA gyrase/topoisomerase IV subunit B